MMIENASPSRFAARMDIAKASPAPPASVSTQRFQHTLESVAASQPLPVPYVIQPGDTLIGIAQRHLAEHDRPVGARELLQTAFALARSNGIVNPDQIWAGESLDLHVLDLHALQRVQTAQSAQTNQTTLTNPTTPPAQPAPLQADAYIGQPHPVISSPGANPLAAVSSSDSMDAGRPVLSQAGQGFALHSVRPLYLAPLPPPVRMIPAPSPETTAAASTADKTDKANKIDTPGTAARNSLAATPGRQGAPTPADTTWLQRTLDRAVAQGFIPPHERGPVENKIFALAERHGFRPDDFALVSLMESDGLNPKASNGRCHGILQFCEGAARGAESVGYRGRANTILELSVLEQLELVDRYFVDVGRAQATPDNLADLYLAVLMPAARSEQNPLQPLPIPGQQAAILHDNQRRDGVITRQSLTRGLQQHAQARLRLSEATMTADSTAAHLASRAQTRFASTATTGFMPPTSRDVSIHGSPRPAAPMTAEQAAVPAATRSTNLSFQRPLPPAPFHRL